MTTNTATREATVDEAIAWVRRRLAGGYRSCTGVVREAHFAGIRIPTLQKARHAAGVLTVLPWGAAGASAWVLPDPKAVEAASRLEGAMVLVREALVGRGPRPQEEILGEASAAGYGRRVVARARAAAGVEAVWVGGIWCWVMPANDEGGGA